MSLARSSAFTGTPPSLWATSGAVASFRLTRADLLSSEASFVLFLFAGRYKKLPELRWFPIDPTILFFASTLGLVAWGLVSGRLRPPRPLPSVVAFALLSELVAVSLFWSSLGPLNTDKALRFLAFTTCGFFVASILGQNAERRQRMLRLITWLSIVLLCYYYYYRYVIGLDIVAVDAIETGRIPADADTYMEYSAHASILFMVFLAFAVLGSWRQMWAVAGVGAALFALASIGGRGSLSMAVLAIPLLAVGLRLRGNAAAGGLKRLCILLVLLSLVASGWLAMESGENASPEQFRTLDRFEMQLSNEDTSSMDERTEGRELAWHLWLERPLFGWGIGEFRVFDSYLDYPHNLLLETLMELGLLGGVLLGVTAIGGVLGCLRVVRDAEAGWVDVAFGLLFLTDLALHLTVQGYLAEDRIFFSYLAIMLAIAPESRCAGR